MALFPTPCQTAGRLCTFFEHAKLLTVPVLSVIRIFPDSSGGLYGMERSGEDDRP